LLKANLSHVSATETKKSDLSIRSSKGKLLVIYNDDIIIKGKVVEASTGLPIPGVSIIGANRKALGFTTAEGNFSISVPIGTEVSFEMLGFQPQKKIAERSELNWIIQMEESYNKLNEVVVTALGIERDEKALGYSTTTVQGKDLTDAISKNWTDALSGKVAGLNLLRSNGGPDGSNKIILRGESNLSGEGNEALIVVDGVVINNGSARVTGYGDKGYLAQETPVDFGSGLNDINPDDIESVTVLKGPGAAALYGQRGANGAIIITTKSGKSNQKGIGVSINSNTSFEDIYGGPDLQYEYGQGTDGDNYYSYNASADGSNTRSTSSAWGPRFNGQEYFQYDPVTHTQATERTPWVPYVNDAFNFFETGKTFTNSVTLDGGTDKTSARFSFTNVNNSWIIPNTGYDRNSVALSVSQKVNDKLKIAAKVNYNNKSSDNLPSTGYNNQSIMYWFLFWEPNASIDWLKDYWMPGAENVSQSYPFSSYPDNPYLIANQMLNKYNRNGFTGNVQATYNFTKDLSLMVRTAMDFANDERSQQRPFDTEKFKRGMYRTQSIYSQEITNDFLIRYNKKFKNIQFSATAGGSMLKNRYNKDEVRADSLAYPGVFTTANSAGVLVSYPYRSEYAINSFYGLLTASYKDFLFVDVTGRNDWNSVLASPIGTDNVSFFYPSVNTSLIVSELFKLPKSISFAKLRASYAGVGSGTTTPYRTSYSYSTASTFPGGLQNPSTLANPYLKPLYTTSYEVGADVRLFNNRFGFDLALYQGNTKNQILSSTVDRSSGVSTVVVNAGLVRNKGIEIALNGSPFKKSNGFSWEVFTTFAANKNEVVSLTDELSQLVLQNGPGSRGSIIAMPGGSMGDLYGRGYEKSPDGQIVYENGYPVITADSKYIGNTNPKWKASIGNTFKYKNFSMNFLFDGQYGAVAYSLSSAVLSEQGKTVNTLPGRYNGIIGNGVIKNTDGTYRPNDVVAQNAWTYYTAHFGRDNVEGATYSTDFIKLRQARLDYTLTSKLTKKLGLQRTSIGIYGRDLLTISNWPVFDPEFGTINNGDINRGFEYAQFPSSRTFGVNLTIGL
jgi:TonB-linked SusC/RagA family outer membrane protein